MCGCDYECAVGLHVTGPDIGLFVPVRAVVPLEALRWSWRWLD